MFDPHYSELAAYYNNCETEARSGVLCRGEGCKGWFLSEVDTWHHCRACNPQATNHPENDYEESNEPVQLTLPFLQEDKNELESLFVAADGFENFDIPF